MLTNFTSAKSQADVAVLGRGIEQLLLVQDRHKDQKLLDWLCPLNFSAQQSEFFSRRQQSSGQWLLTHDNFKGWLATPKEHFFALDLLVLGRPYSQASHRRRNQARLGS